jgi:hypothetical protein
VAEKKAVLGEGRVGGAVGYAREGRKNSFSRRDITGPCGNPIYSTGIV